MRMITTYGDMWVVCISIHDPGAVTRWHDYGVTPTFCTLEDERVAYLEHGAERTIVQPAKNVSAARNAALRDAWEQDLSCLLLDDDPAGRPFLVYGWPPRKVMWREAFVLLQERVHHHDLMCGVLNRTTNPVHIGREIRLRSRISGGVMYIRPTPLLFDENVGEMEDIDYGLQHMEKYGGVVRFDSLAAPMTQDDSDGSLGPNRDENRAACFRYLTDKWGDKVVHRPRSYNPYMLEPADYGKRVKI